MSNEDDTQGNEIKWGEEAENLSEGGEHDYWTSPTGESKITFLDDGTQYTDKKKFDETEQTYVKFQIEVDGEEYVWDMKKGSTPGSKFGQLARYAAKNNGLEGDTITWFRQGEGQQTNHVLMNLADNVEEEESEEESEEEVF